MAGDITLAPDGTGKGSFRINPADMNGQGLALSDCSDVIVAAMSRVDPREARHPVMSGSIAFPRSIAETSTGTSAAEVAARLQPVLQQIRARQLHQKSRRNRTASQTSSRSQTTTRARSGKRSPT